MTKESKPVLLCTLRSGGVDIFLARSSWPFLWARGFGLTNILKRHGLLSLAIGRWLGLDGNDSLSSSCRSVGNGLKSTLHRPSSSTRGGGYDMLASLSFSVEDVSKSVVAVKR